MSTKVKATILIVITICLIIAFGILVVLHQTRQLEYPYVTVSTSDLLQDILSTTKGKEKTALVTLNDETLLSEYQISSEEVQDYAVMVPMMNLTVTEYAVIKVVSMDKVDSIKEKCRTRASIIAQKFDGYLDAQYEIAITPLILSKGRYVFMAITENKEQVKDIFESYFN